MAEVDLSNQCSPQAIIPIFLLSEGMLIVYQHTSFQYVWWPKISIHVGYYYFNNGVTASSIRK